MTSVELDGAADSWVSDFGQPADDAGDQLYGRGLAQAPASEPPAQQAEPAASASDFAAAESGEPVPVDAGTGAPPEQDAAGTGAPGDAPAEFVADAGNVVRLPANASIDNIRVEGDDLVLEQADGTLIVIKDAAANVPTFVIGEVEVPRVALLAALEGSGVDVAFGADGSINASPGPNPPDSSGGNFEQPPGGIGDGFDLTALLPPTALAFPQYEEKELYPSFRREENAPPTITVDTGNPEGANDQVLEEGLNPGGSNAVSDGEYAAGTFTLSDGNGLADLESVTITGVGGSGTFTIAQMTGATVGSPLTVVGDHGTLRITGYNAGTGVATYTYELTEATTDVDNVAETDSFTLTVSDGSGPSAPASIIFEIVDDVPTAVADTDSVTEDGPLTADGNVISGVGGGTADTQGADGVVVTGVAAGTPASASGQVGSAVPGSYGSITIGADGAYVYTLDNGNAAVQALTTGQTLTDTFTYTITDNDGDPSTTTVTITINGSNDVPTVTVPQAGAPGTEVSEAGLPARAGEPAGSASAGSSETTTGSFSYTHGDGASTVTINNVAVAVGATVSGDYGTLTITSIVGTTVTYSYTLADNVDNDTDLTPFESFTVKVADSDGNPADDASSTFQINIVDDVPTANPATAAVLDDEGLALGIAGGFGDAADTSVTAGPTALPFIPGADGAASIVASLASANGEAGSIAQLQAVYVDPLTLAATTHNVTTSWQQNGVGGVLTGTMNVGGSVGVVTVFTLTIDNAGAYTLAMQRPLAHPLTADATLPAETEYEDNISLVFNYTVTDGDGDTSQSTLTVSVDDDTLDIGAVEAAEIGNGPVTVVGDFVVNSGADGIKAVDFTTLPSGLHSGGLPLQYVQSGNTLIAYTTSVGSPVFTITLNPAGDSYTLQKFQPLDGTTSLVTIGGSTAFGAGPGSSYILESGTGEDLAIVSGWTSAGAIAEVNGSTGGWGVGNNNLNDDDMLRFDFQDADNFDGPGGYSPPAFTGPAVSAATFGFSQFASGANGDVLGYVVRYTDGTSASGTLTTFGDHTFTAPAGKFIDYVEITGDDVGGGGGKVTLKSVARLETVVDIDFGVGVTLTDGDGDKESATINISVVDSTPSISDLTPAASGGDVTVDEDDLLASRGSGESAGSDTSPDSTTVSGAFTVTSPDGVQSLTVGGLTVITNGVFAAGSIVTPLGNTLEITAYNPVNGQISYQYTLNDNEAHPAANGENDLFENFAVVVTDPQGQAASDTLAVRIIDDVSTATDNSRTVDAGQVQTVDLRLIVDMSGSMGPETASGWGGGPIGFIHPDYSNDRIGLARYSLEKFLNENPQVQNVQIVRFAQFADTAAVWMSREDALTFIQDDANWTIATTSNSNPLGFGSGTYYSAAIDAVIDQFDAVPGPSSPSDQSLVYFITDGNPSTSSSNSPVSPAQQAAWEALIDSGQIDAAYAVAFGNTVFPEFLTPIAHPSNDDVVLIPDVSNADALSDTLGDLLVPESIAGNVLLDDPNPATTGSDAFGADGPGYVKSITIDGVQYTFDGSDVTPGVPPVGGAILDSGDTWIQVKTVLGGTLTFHFGTSVEGAAGGWSYLAPTTITNPTAAQNFAYTIVDSDGDEAPANLNITVVQPANYAPTDILWTPIVPADGALPGVGVIANLSAVDPDNASGFTYALLGGSSSNFSIDASTGAVSRTGSGLADNTTYTLNVQVADVFGATFDKTFTIRTGTSSGQTITGSSGVDIIYALAGGDTLTGGAGRDVMLGQGGDDDFNLANGNFVAGEYIHGGGGTDEIVLTNSTTVDFTTGTITSVETLTGSGSNDSVTLTAAQLDGFTTINLAGGTGDILNITSTSTALNGLSNGNLAGVETVSAASAAAGVTINLGSQTEAINVTGSISADTITAATGGGAIDAGLGGDSVKINAAALTSRSWTINLGSDAAQDTLIFNHTAIDTGHQTLVTVDNFNAGGDRIAITLNGTSVTSTGVETITGDNTTFSGTNRIVEIAINSANRVTTSLNNDGDGSSIEQIIQSATNGFPATGNYTFIIYSDLTTSANAGIYSVNISDDTNPGNGGMVVEHIMTLNGVGFGALGASNFVNLSVADPIVLDLDNNGFLFSTLAAGVSFDLNGDGAKDELAWNSSGDGILAYDRDGDGVIDDGTELFTPWFNGGDFASGGEALASLDSNGDGVVDAADNAFDDLSIWQDLDGDGITDEGELGSLADHGIASITAPATAAGYEIDGQSIIGEGAFTRTDGTTGDYVEVALDAVLGAGELVLVGGDGDDILEGIAGRVDTLIGGAGADTFVINDLSAVDIIADYHSAEGDSIDLSALLDTSFGAGSNEADFLRVVADGSDARLQVDVDGGAGGENFVDVAVLQNFNPTLDTIKLLFDNNEHTTSNPTV